MHDHEPANQFRREAVVRFLNWRKRKRRKSAKVRRVIERQDDAASAKAMDAAGFVEGGWDELNL